MKVLEYASEHTGAEAINLGTGNGISVLELVRAFESANEMKLNFVIGPAVKVICLLSGADAAKAKKLLGWEATHSVEDMCRSAWQFARNSK